VSSMNLRPYKCMAKIRIFPCGLKVKLCPTIHVWWSSIGSLLCIPCCCSVVLKIHVPGLPTLLVLVTLMMSSVPDPGMLKKFSPSLASYPATAGPPPNPFVSSEASISPVVHCISPAGYRNMIKDCKPSVASTHWNVFLYNIKMVIIWYTPLTVCT